MKPIRLSRIALTFSLVLSVGCDQGSELPIGDDGRADTNGCMNSEELASAARTQLIDEEPEFYTPSSFSDEEFVEALEDLNGDGVEDALVFPGLSYAGANVEQVVYLSDAAGCLATFAGHFGSSSVTASEDGVTTNGVRDLIGTNVSGCEAASTRYTFDGQRYVEAGTEIENLCEELCITAQDEIGLIGSARDQLMLEEPDFYTVETLNDSGAFVEIIEDLNGDGLQDALVFPGWSYAGANVEQTVFLSDLEGCMSYAGHMGSSAVTPSEDGATTNGVRDLIGTNVSGCEATNTRYTFDGQRYVEAGFEVEDLCQ